MPLKTVSVVLFVAALAVVAAGCYPNPSPPNLTPIPTLAGPVPTLEAVAAATGAPTSEPRPTGAAAQGDPQAGMALFTQNCTACHGANAQGGVGPALKGNKFIQSSQDDAIFNTVANGRPGTAMPPWSQAKGGKLTDKQIDDLVAYLKVLQK